MFLVEGIAEFRPHGCSAQVPEQRVDKEKTIYQTIGVYALTKMDLFVGD